MILLSELSRRRIRSINKLVRVGRTEIVMVIRVDKEKGTTTIMTTASIRISPTILFTYLKNSYYFFPSYFRIRISPTILFTYE